MSEQTKTIAFIVTAAALVGAATASHYATQPKSNSDFELVGTPFFEDFTSSDAAKSLEVSAIDPETLSLKQFSVKNDNGLWRIPSHHNYPAEAAARLASTATSVIGIERESLAGRNAKEHERLGVVDPLEADTEVLEDAGAAGKRITLKDGSGEVLVDFIIGKEAGEVATPIGDASIDQSSPQKYYYVRRADEQQTYKVKLAIDLSTKFADWIDPDLLRLDPNKLVRLEINNYSLVEERDNLLGQVRALTKVQADKMDFSRGSSTEPWQLADLIPETEELISLKVNAISNVLDEIKIAGVRPKFKYQDHLLLTPDLKLNARPEFKKNPQEFGAAIQQLQDELEDRGFSLAGTSEELQLVSTNGELEIGTNEGLLYKLQFGKEVEGKEQEIEIGLDKVPAAKAEPTADDSETHNTEKEKDPTEPADGAAVDVAAEDSTVEKNRYLMIRVAFDETLLGTKPAKPSAPIEPKKPEGYEPPPAEDRDSKTEENQNEEAAGDSDQADSDAPPNPNGEDKPDAKETPARKTEFVEYDSALAAYEQAKVEFELATSRFGDEQKAFDAKIAVGKKLVDEMNQRFSDWYYVISAANLKQLQNTRAEMVTTKEVPREEQEPELPNKPDISFPEVDQ